MTQGEAELGQMVRYRLVSANLGAELAALTTCLPLGIPLLRKDVGTGPDLQMLPGSPLHYPFITIPSLGYPGPTYFPDTSLGPCLPTSTLS